MKTRKNNNKKSLVLSACSAVLCFAMLAGSTFAWFSDSASGKNLIHTGNLDVELKHMTSEGVQKVEADTPLFLNVDGEAILWEPGAVATETFVVENAGTLALKYDLGLNAADETGITDTEGNTYYLRDEALKVAIVEATVAEDGTVTPVEVTRESIKTMDMQALADADLAIGSLEAGKTKAYTVVVYWEPINNDFDNIFNLNNGGAGSYEMDLNIALNATQEASESDSIGSDYDAGAYADLPTGGTNVDEDNQDDPLA